MVKYPCSDANRAVICAHVCTYCGFNPAEQKRRLETGKFVTIKTRHAYETSRSVDVVTKDCQTLQFKKGGK